MSNPGDADATPVRSARQLADYIAQGCKPRAQFSIGTEHEKFGFRERDHAPPPYQPDGIRAVLEGMAQDGWTPILDDGQPIGLARGRASVSLEPAGQLELSGGTLATLHETRAELAAHFEQLRPAAARLGLGFAPLGFHPTMRRDQMPWMPKRRYAIMRRYMPTVGTLGLDMMTRTCTVQVNLDYESEADMVRKLQVSLALQPVATALFANSPFTEGRPNGFLSYRAQIWTDTDNARSGAPALFFDEGFGFERYVDWLLDIPMYFVIRSGAYIDMTEFSFRAFMAGAARRRGVGEATVGDFADHMTTVFTDVRVKRFLEMRGADAGSPELMLSQSAFWVGLLYDSAAFDAIFALVRRTGWDGYRELRRTVPRQGLSAAWGRGNLRELARDVVQIAREGLRSRCRHDPFGRDESCYIEPLIEMTEGAPSQAERWLAKYHGEWRGDATRIFDEARV
jgi:glutamate--cysteine ligase